MNLSINSYVNNLSNSYENVSKRFFLREDFEENNLLNSRKLFTLESLNKKIPLPKKFEVYALLSGISFQNELIVKLYEIQNKLREIIPENLAYFVKPKNLGLEHCVFKWPEDKWDNKKEKSVIKFLDLYDFNPFKIEIIGFQIHQDGCIIAKGYDKSMEMMKIRNFFKSNLKFYPSKQSDWSHIPLGRILEPIGKNNYEKLKQFIIENKKKFIASEIITSYKFIHERRWYMEEKEIIKSIQL